MATTMNISGYEIEREEVATDKYDDEAMRAEWITRLQVNELPAATEDRRTAFPPELVNVDIDDFLQKMYEYRR
jgi:hypothetical protein